MNTIVAGLMTVLAVSAAVYTDIPEYLERLYEDGVLAAQQIATAGDMRTMSVMLDTLYIMERSIPSEAEFPGWIQRNFKENNIKSLAADHWGNPYSYKVLKKNKVYTLRSAGPDGTFGTGDDLVVKGP